MISSIFKTKFQHNLNYFYHNSQLLNVSLIECISDLIQLLSTENEDDFLIELKAEKSSSNINHICDESTKKLHFNRRYRALMNSREILLDDLSMSINEDVHIRMIKMRAVCVLDEELIYIQQEYLSKSCEEQVAIRLQQIRSMINVYFKQTCENSCKDSNSSLIPLIQSCDSFLSTFRLFLSNTSSDS
ncbi:hypothetical protein I4U23_018342 [Adineta vaga]|nr:hypothetical protein I4U23_018342 [Adineta vaga]